MIPFTILWVDVEDSRDQGDDLTSLKSDTGDDTHGEVECKEEKHRTGKYRVSPSTDLLVGVRGPAVTVGTLCLTLVVVSVVRRPASEVLTEMSWVKRSIFTTIFECQIIVQLVQSKVHLP